MELNTIIELVKAGFTKDEILQMEQQTGPITNPQPVQMAMDLPPQEAEPQPIPAQVAEPSPVPVPAPVPVQEPQAEPNQPTMADIMQGIAKLTSAIQSNAIANSVIPGGLQNPPKAEDMLAQIIRPTYKERG